MKKLMSLLALVTILSICAKAQDQKNVIKANPLGLLFGSANLSYERALTEKSSIAVSPSFGSYKLGGFKYSSVGLGAEYRFYLSSSKNAPEGVYVSPAISYTSGKVSYEDAFFGTAVSDAKFGGLQVKGVFGKQWIWDSGFTIDLNGGISYINFSYTDNSNTAFSGLKGSGVLPTLAFGIGYAF